MNDFYQRFFDRLRNQTLKSLKITTNAEWVAQNTRLGNDAFTYKHRKYQPYVLNLAGKAREMAIIKPSQIGISEVMSRLLLAMLINRIRYQAILVFPSHTFSQLFVRTRIDPVIADSPVIKEQINAKHDSGGSKMFLNGSGLYTRGASRTSQAISIPADGIFCDELSFMESMSIVKSFYSRLTASPYKNRFSYSTPTYVGDPIDKAVTDSEMTHWEEIRCDKCNHTWKPNYFQDVILPGWNGIGDGDNQLGKLTNFKVQTHGLILGDAFLCCPSCHRQVDYLDEDQHVWVTSRDGSGLSLNADTHGVYLTPWCAPSFITPGDLIKAMLSYANTADFYNFALGLPYASSESGLDEQEINACRIEPGEVRGLKIVGGDLGGMSALMIGRGVSGIIDEENPLIVTDMFYSNIENFKRELPADSAATVLDSMPYTTLVRDLQQERYNLWGSVFRPGAASGVLYEMKEKDKNSEKAVDTLRRLVVDRAMLLDTVVDMIRTKKIRFMLDDMQMTQLRQHLQSMKKAKVLSEDSGEIKFVWRHTDGEDHFFFALGYLILADRLKYLGEGPGLKLPLLRTLRLRQSLH